MSKYIRTNNEICEIVEETKDTFIIKGDIGFGNTCVVEKEDCIKQADTIEELIECYAVILERQDRPLIVFKNEIEHYKHCLVDKVKSNNRVLAIYGSIWAGADLLSKSKMNEKGELELL